MNTPRTRITNRKAKASSARPLTEKQIESIATSIYQISRTMAATQMVVQCQPRIVVAELSSVETPGKIQSHRGLTAFAGFAEKVAQLNSAQQSSHTTAAH